MIVNPSTTEIPAVDQTRSFVEVTVRCPSPAELVNEAALRSDVVRLASPFGRYGYRQITNLLQIEGWRVNHKRVERKLRDELLNGEIFYSLAEAAVLVEQWRREYNTVRPHSACGGFPPAPEAIKPSPWFLRMPVLHGPPQVLGLT